MLISHRHRFIFVHIYKNAGSSIVAALKPYAVPWWQQKICNAVRHLGVVAPFDPERFHPHILAIDLMKALGKEKYSSYFSFAIVRNPWDWQVSMYKYVLSDTAHHQHELFKSFGSFDNYIQWRCQESGRQQRDFIYSPEGNLLVDFVGRFERLDEDFAEICSRIGISASLPKLNVSNNKPYREFYTDETKELVRKTFAVDCETFGYDF